MDIRESNRKAASRLVEYNIDIEADDLAIEHARAFIEFIEENLTRGNIQHLFQQFIMENDAVDHADIIASLATEMFGKLLGPE